MTSPSLSEAARQIHNSRVCGDYELALSYLIEREAQWGPIVGFKLVKRNAADDRPGIALVALLAIIDLGQTYGRTNSTVALFHNVADNGADAVLNRLNAELKAFNASKQ